MGKIRSILERLFKYQPKKGLISPICTHPNLPEQQQHTNLVVNAKDYCYSCEEHMCLVCSEVHVRNHCHVNRNNYVM